MNFVKGLSIFPIVIKNKSPFNKNLSKGLITDCEQILNPDLIFKQKCCWAFHDNILNLILSIYNSKQNLFARAGYYSDRIFASISFVRGDCCGSRPRTASQCFLFNSSFKSAYRKNSFSLNRYKVNICTLRSKIGMMSNFRANHI